MASVPVGAVRIGDINRKNDDRWHIATTLESPRILHARRNSHVMAPPEVLMPYFWDASFGQAVMLADFHFDLTLLSAFVERWRPETHSFHMSWDVAYHLGLRTHGDPIGGAMRDFETHYRHPTCGWVEELLGARPEQKPEARKESFSLKMVWHR
ncbi:hypothetical protein PIB30_051127 [Stylosanthes scabra]|uniref:Aminotransferase-like plant mobile domain-containing protein n=1 Tax=Stylosanthes scabra TaxID=79078 RepID=A0ABU6XG05_9FABA|nr:hypothetical protein [Stylosanthes scabra]